MRLEKKTEELSHKKRSYREKEDLSFTLFYDIEEGYEGNREALIAKAREKPMSNFFLGVRGPEKGTEFFHIKDPAKRKKIRERMESKRVVLQGKEDLQGFLLTLCEKGEDFF